MAGAQRFVQSCKVQHKIKWETLFKFTVISHTYSNSIFLPQSLSPDLIWYKIKFRNKRQHCLVTQSFYDFDFGCLFCQELMILLPVEWLQSPVLCAGLCVSSSRDRQLLHHAQTWQYVITLKLLLKIEELLFRYKYILILRDTEMMCFKGFNWW